MQRNTDDLVCESDAQDNMVAFEGTSSQVVDVKVCDICGDIGEEEKLAICCRCNDGAEHTYCMKVMIEDIPEGDWFCEVCRDKEHIEEQHKKLEISQVKAGTVSSKNTAGIEHVALTNWRLQKRREFKNCEICGDVGEQEKLAFCSRCNDGAEHIYCMRVMMEEVPNVWWLCEACQSEVEAEKKTSELQKCQAKNGVLKGLPAEGTLINPVNNENIRSSKNEMDAKCVGIEESEIRDEENYMVTQKKEAEAGATSCAGQNLRETGGLSTQADHRKRVLSRRSSFKSDMENEKHASGQLSNSYSSEKVSNSLASIAPKEKAQPDHGQLSKSVSFNSSKIPKVKQLGYDEVHLRPKLLKESSSCITKKVGQSPTSTLAVSTSFKKTNFGDPEPKAKTPLKLPAEVTRVMNQWDSQHVKNNRASSIAYPPICSPIVAPLASQAACTGQYDLKKPLLVKGPGSTMLSSAKGSEGFLGPDPKRKAVQVSYPMLKVGGYDTAYMIGRALDSPTMPSDLGDKTQVFCNRDSTPHYEPIALSIPKMDYVWQGSFELWGTGSLPGFCDGLQGHISCSSSPELIEAAKKLPSKIKLQELPRQSVWPSEFQQNYDNIDIFFFARDSQSYEYYYSKLVENIMKDDLALRGSTETVELIIFSSGTLPEDFQRWNMFYFLWGVLRVKRSLNIPPGLPVSETSNFRFVWQRVNWAKCIQDQYH